jgi:phosphinothricin acetyltransferase
MKIRQAKPEDALRLLKIYAPIVETTTISFECTVPSAGEFAARISTSIAKHDWLVLEDGAALCGYAYGTPHRQRDAYRPSVETSVYVNRVYRGRQVGSRLYNALFDSLSDKGFHNAFAAITMPNEASIAFHKSVGFEYIGTFREVGYKFDAWCDVSWWQRPLTA